VYIVVLFIFICMRLLSAVRTESSQPESRIKSVPVRRAAPREGRREGRRKGGLDGIVWDVVARRVLAIRLSGNEGGATSPVSSTCCIVLCARLPVPRFPAQLG